MIRPMRISAHQISRRGSRRVPPCNGSPPRGFQASGHAALRRVVSRSAGIGLLLALLAQPACGHKVDRNAESVLRTCQDMGGTYHFRAYVPPWKYNKEYQCSNWQDGKCLGTWSPTGRYLFIISDVPFVNFDSEIVTSLEVIRESGDTASLVRQLIADEAVGEAGSTATFTGAPEDYPKERLGNASGALPGHEIFWQQDRDFQGATYNWYRRDTFLRAAGGHVYHLRFFSIGTLDRPEFEALVDSFREGADPDGAPYCQCRDEHDPAGPSSC